MIPEQLVDMLSSYLARDLVLLPFAVALIWLLRRHGLTGLIKISPAGMPVWRQAAGGIAYAIAALVIIILPAWLAGGFSSGSPDYHEFSYLVAKPGSGDWLVISSTFLLQALWEELLFRCIGVGALAWLLFWLWGMFVPDNQDESSPNEQWTRWIYSGLVANLVVAVAFALAHSTNSGVSRLGLVNIMLAGLVLGQLFVNSANMFSPWAFHFAWNMGLIVLGLPVSGYAIAPAASALGFSGAVTGLISGGRFGPEGSAVSTVVLVCLAGWLIYSAFAQPVTAEQSEPGIPDQAG